MHDIEGTVRTVFATVALGMRVNLCGVNRVVHYGAPRSLEDYFQECGRAGRSGDQSFSTIYWCPHDVPRYKDISDPRKQEVTFILKVLGCVEEKKLLQYFIGNQRPVTLCAVMYAYVSS